jgi:hypothetical protein
MKWFFFMLLVANLGMFILIYPQKTDNELDNSLPDVGGLYLYEELVALKADSIVTETTPVTGVDKMEAETGSEYDSMVEKQSDEQPPEAGSANGPASAVEAAATTDEDKPVSEAETKVTDDAVAMAEQPQPATASACRTLGYLATRSDAEIVSVNLRAMGLKPELQSETSNEQAGIWVLIPPQTSRRKAISIANSLEQDGVTDIWRFTSGELVHAISLGLFRNMERAEIRKREIESLGYEVAIQPRYRQQTKYLFYFQEDTPLSEGKNELNELLGKFPYIEIKEVTCR